VVASISTTWEGQTPDINQLIGDRYPILTKSEKQIADFIQKNQEESAFLSAGEIAQRLGLSEATMVRFARNLGFNSYPAMRTVLQEAFRHRVTHSARLSSRLDDMKVDGDILERLTATEIDFLSQALETVNRDQLRRGVELLHSHNRIFVFGVGPSISLVDLLSIRLGRFGHQVIPLTTTGREILEPLISMSDQDLLFAIGFFDMSVALQTVLDRAKGTGCPVIFLTDTLASIVGDRANVILSARRGPTAEFHSMVVPMTIINSMLLAVAQEDRTVVMQNLDQLDHLRESFKKANRALS
jgi:DNA-binding MurR/RpiR family transcriptional regulator